ncbi:hypothetical protein MPTK1_8g08630 [Marchantia polymorpha subsp. ruderalis]|uniref:Uncharacterized protein n=1 Tax=Marchantia polymorpha TaxID=3197 RepID=A0A2R6WRN6_MARPO|nr:hypothetical protein MARPO_0063s0056 [Marchantia polymorpha]BBN19200.1 hypothetical protein Mp_8g08630 [Marchantia polymorpha subsp. ruderalis]|eukprot:PTQ36512.1 hypothetical protein MARPO_0063s0056 [Marchantia polymorpha]
MIFMKIVQNVSSGACNYSSAIRGGNPPAISSLGDARKLTVQPGNLPRFHHSSCACTQNENEDRHGSILPFLDLNSELLAMCQVVCKGWPGPVASTVSQPRVPPLKRAGTRGEARRGGSRVETTKYCEVQHDGVSTWQETDIL